MLKKQTNTAYSIIKADYHIYKPNNFLKFA